MDFSRPTPEPEPWPTMTDAQRLAYFAQCAENQPVDRAAFNALLESKRLQKINAPEQ